MNHIYTKCQQGELLSLVNPNPRGSGLDQEPNYAKVFCIMIGVVTQSESIYDEKFKNYYESNDNIVVDDLMI